MSDELNLRVEFKKYHSVLENMYGDDDDEADKPHSFGGQVAVTDFGLIPVNEKNSITSHFNFWLGHTNFVLEDKHIHVIDTTLGVETLTIYTPYTFRIAIGKLFDPSTVMNDVRNNLINYTLAKSPKKELTDINYIKSLSKQFKFFAVMVFEGKKHIIKGQDRKDVEQQVAEFTKGKKITSLQYSWDIND